MRLLLHSCCAPCSAAIVEHLLENAVDTTVFFSNSNIFPQDEYLHRRAELERHLQALGIPFVEDDYDHSAWLASVRGLEQEPERGSRCTQCFRFRLLRAASYAAGHAFTHLATTLASSRWKNIDQVNAAGQWAVGQVGTTEVPLQFLDRNWRKGGLQERRAQLLRQYAFYNQQYCGCEFSIRKSINDNREERA